MRIKSKAVMALLGVAMAACVHVGATTIYVVPPVDGHEPGAPYNTWTNAATNLHDALAAVTGAKTNIFVSNGVYVVTNGVGILVDQPVYIRSWNEGALDQTNTVISGGGTSRGLLLSNANAVVDGLMVSNCYRPGANATNNGAGMLIYAGTVRNCDVVSNLHAQLTASFFGGGGIAIATNGMAVIENTVIRANRAYYGGGGLLASGATNLVLNNCSVLQNFSTNSGGGVLIYYSRNVVMSNCAVLGNNNRAVGCGVNIYVSSNVVVSGCLVANNTVQVNTACGGIYAYIGNDIVVTNCDIVGNVAGWGAGLRTFFPTNFVAQDCRITDNISTGSYGSVEFYGGTLRNCLVARNTATSYGAGICVRNTSAPMALIENCTVVSNTSQGNSGGGIYLVATASDYTVLRNNIIHHNISAGSYSNYYGVILYGRWTNNCIAQGAIDFNAAGTNNIKASPLLADIAGNNFRLRANSPCINAGTNQDWMTGALDLDGADRLTYTNEEGVLTVDMGCYEYPVPDLTVTPLTFSRTAMRGTINVMPVTLQAVGPITNYVDTPWAVNIASNWIWAGVKRGVIPNAAPTASALTNVTADLPAGVYNGTAVYAVTNRFLPFAQVSSQVVSVALSVMELTATPAVLSNTVMVGSIAPTQSFQVVSAGQGALSYTVVTNGAAAWVAVSPGSGTLANNATNSIKLTYNTAGLTPGLHTASLTLATTNHGGATQMVGIVMEVLELSFTPGALTNQALAGFAAPPRSLVVRNLGAGSFDYTLATNAVWLSVTPAFGTASGAGTTHVVAYASTALAPGAHAGVITLASSDHGGITQSVAATLNILSLDRAPALLTQSAERGATPAATGFDVWNGGAGRLDFAIASATAWLGVTPSAGMSTGIADRTAITVSFVNTRNFAEGAYTGAVLAAGTDGAAGGATQAVTVVLNVLAKVPGWLTAGDGDRVDGVLLQWEDAQAQAYEVWRARVSDFSDGALLARVVGSHEYLDTSALYGELYYYRARPENLLGGYGRYSPSDTGWRGLAPPTDVSASQGQYTNRVHVTWAPVPNAQRYEVWRAEVDAPVAAVRITTPDVEAVEFDDYTAVVDVTYYYWAKAKTDYTSGFSESAEGYRSALPPPGTLAASAGAYTNKVRLTWGGVAGALEYEIWRAASADGESALLALVNALGYDDFVVAQGVRYYYSVRARNRQSRSGLSSVVEGYADVGRAGLDLSGLAVTPAMIRAGGAPGAMGVNLRNLGPRAMSAPDGWLRFDLILSTTTNIADGVVAWSGTKYVAASAGNEVWVDLGDLIAGAGAAKMQIPARFRGVYWLFLRTVHTPPSTLTGADAGRNAVMYASPVEIRRGTVRDCTGDWCSDLLVYDRASGQWAVKPVAGGAGVYFDLGLPGGVGVSGDYDGDGLSDAVMFRDGAWSARLSANAQAVTTTLGALGFQAVSGDFDGDGVSDPAVYRESDGMWYALLSGGAWHLVVGQFGGPGFQPVSGDFDGDGVSDPAIYREADGQWYAVLPGGIIGGRFGGPGYQPLTGDFNGDGVSDAAVHAVTTGEWQVYLMGSGGVLRGYFGGPGFLPVTGDFDGDRRCDVGIYRPDLGLWRLVRVDGTVILWNWQWGGPEWMPVR